MIRGLITLGLLLVIAAGLIAWAIFLSVLRDEWKIRRKRKTQERFDEERRGRIAAVPKGKIIKVGEVEDLGPGCVQIHGWHVVYPGNPHSDRRRAIPLEWLFDRRVERDRRAQSRIRAMTTPPNPHPVLPGPDCKRCRNTGFFAVGKTWARACPDCGRLVSKTPRAAAPIIPTAPAPASLKDEPEKINPARQIIPTAAITPASERKFADPRRQGN